MLINYWSAIPFWIGISLCAESNEWLPSSSASVTDQILLTPMSVVMRTEDINVTVSFSTLAGADTAQVSSSLSFNLSTYPSLTRVLDSASARPRPTSTSRTLPIVTPPHEKRSGRPFDTASFIGGMLLMLGLLLVTVLVKKFLRTRTSYRTL